MSRLTGSYLPAVLTISQKAKRSTYIRPQAAVTYLREILKVSSSIRAYRQNFGSQNTYKKESENVLDFQTIPPETSLEQRKAHGPEATAQTQGDMVDPGRS
jgi:hypothetical protein